jgi:dipeptidyl aminopeptidase/acylaminoacyl peptidase
VFNPADLYQIRWVEDVQVSPDGRTCAYVVKQATEDGAAYVSSIWLCSLGDRTHTQVTGNGQRVRSPRWSPDGRRLAFVSDRGGSGQLWLVSPEGGDERQLTRLVGGAGDPAWSPDGAKIAFVSRVPALERGDDDEPIGGPAPQVRYVRRLNYKWDGKGWWDGKWSHVFKVGLDGDTPVQLTSGDFDHSAPEWSPDGTRLAFVALRTPDPDYHHYLDIWVMPAEGGGMRKVTSSLGPVVRPCWSPDGGTIAYLGHDNRYERQTVMGLYLVDAVGGRPERNILAGYDYPAVGMVTGDMVNNRPGCCPVFTRDGDLLVITTVAGSQQIERVAVEGGMPRAVTRAGQVVYDLSYAPGPGILAYLASTPESIGDLYVVNRLGEEPIRLTHLNEEFLCARAISGPERVAFAGTGGDEVEGWLYKPPGFDPSRKHPLVLYIHGGSSPCHGYAFSLDFQVLTSAGVIVFAPNQRGSQGYGQARAASVKHDWCGADYEDLMLGTDFVCALPYVDQSRIGVTGGSYGGLLTNWAVTHTKRFAAAVAQRSTSNRYSNYGTCDEGTRISLYIYPCDPWDDPGYYMDRSPVIYVRKVETPLLLLHSDEDYRCNLEQAEQFYRGLKRLGKEVEMVIFRGENHGLSSSGRPFNRVERVRQIRRWFRKYLTG